MRTFLILLLMHGLTPSAQAQTPNLTLATPQPTPETVQVGSTVPAPCLSSNEISDMTKSKTSTIMPKCSDFFSPKKSFKFLEGYYKFFTHRIECYYNGFIVPNFKDGKEDANKEECTQGQEVGSSIGPKKITCSINDGEGVLSGLSSAPNHLGESCGNFRAQDSSWEIAQFTGLGVQATKYYREEVAREMVLKNILRVTSAMCQGQASDYLQHLSTAKNLASQVPLHMTQPQLSAYESGNICDTPAAPTSEASVTSNTGACYFYASMHQLSLLFAYVAECEVLRRVDGFSADLLDNHLDGIKKAVTDCTAEGTEYGNRIDVLSESAGKAKGAQCYAQKAQAYFRDIVSTLIPGNFTSEPASNLFGP